MAEHSRFFDSKNPLAPERTYTAREFLSYFGAIITDGVMKGYSKVLKVETSGSNMNTTVDTGTAFLLAHQYENDSKLSLTHEIEALGKSRIDRVVLRLVLDKDDPYIRAFVKKGVAGTAPVPPPLTREEGVYEISLAQVKVIGGQTYINTSDVKDERGTPDICPWASSYILPNFNDAALEDLVNKVNSTAVTVQEMNTRLSSVYGNLIHGPGWTEPYSGLTQILKANGFVYVRLGLMKSAQSKDLITNIPAGMRPPENLPVTLLANVNGTPTTINGIAQSDGQIRFASAAVVSQIANGELVTASFSY